MITTLHRFAPPLQVTHAGPGTDLPSIAGSVATIDGMSILISTLSFPASKTDSQLYRPLAAGNRSKYSSEIRAQRNPCRGASQEIMIHAKDMVKEHLKRWIAKNGSGPDNIIFFRVSRL